MESEEQLSRLLNQAVRTLDPPTGPLVAAALERGRTLRRRRRATHIGSALAVCGLIGGVAAAVVTVPSARSGADRPGIRAAAGPTSATGPTQRAMVRVTPQAVLQTAIDTLPRPGQTSQYVGNADAGANVAFVYDDGGGAALIQASVHWPNDVNPATGASVHSEALPSACDPSTAGCTVLPDGAHAQTMAGLEYRYGQHPDLPNATEYSVTLVRPDGVQVFIDEQNADQLCDSSAPLTRDKPPFTLDELIAWADNAQWSNSVPQAYADAAAHLFTTRPLPPPAVGDCH